MEYTKAEDLLSFLDNSPCNFFAVKTIKSELEAKGFVELKASDKWQIKKGGKYYVTKNDTAIFAVKVGNKPISETGFKIIAAHCDSPCMRIKPNPELYSDGVIRLNAEIYGGPILYTWFDRPLSLAGRVMIHNPQDPLHPTTKLINFNRPVLIIPHLAIHFNRNVNEGNKLSKQKDMIPVAGIITNKLEKHNFLLNKIAEELSVKIEDIVDFDLSVYNYQKASLVGFENEFITSGRIDDLSMAHAAICAILDGTDTDNTCISAIFDNEETGSGTKQGAASPVLANIMRRIAIATDVDEEGFYQSLDKTFMISADNAHAAHPNYPEKYDITNHPVMGGGPVVKINANCKYMTDAKSSSVFIELCRRSNVPYQYFVNHSDVAGGSTLGNILTSQIDITGVDMGNPIWAMHSAMETGSIKDHEYVIKLFTDFFC